MEVVANTATNYNGSNQMCVELLLIALDQAKNVACSVSSKSLQCCRMQIQLKLPGNSIAIQFRVESTDFSSGNISPTLFVC